MNTKSRSINKSFMHSVKTLFMKYNYYFIFVLLIIASSIVSKDFMTTRNIMNLLRQNAGNTILAVGMLLVVLTGGIDLSMGSILAVASVTISFAYVNWGVPMIVAIFGSILICALLGAMTGIMISWARMAPFIATLAMQTIARGFAYVFSDGTPIRITSSPIGLLGTGSLFGLPYLFYFMIIVVFICFFILKFTSYGRIVTAIGSNATAVRLSGINIAKYKFSVYVLSGICAGLAGIISIARTDVGSPIVGNGSELDAIAAVVIGGASMSGGKGSALPTFIGVLILGMITNIMNLLSVPAYPQQIIRGLIIVAAVMLQNLNRNSSFKE